MTDFFDGAYQAHTVRNIFASDIPVYILAIENGNLCACIVVIIKINMDMLQRRNHIAVARHIYPVHIEIMGNSTVHSAGINVAVTHFSGKVPGKGAFAAGREAIYGDDDFGLHKGAKFLKISKIWRDLWIRTKF